MTDDGGSLPAGWDAAQSPDGKTYYFNIYTHETRWTRPTIADAVGDTVAVTASAGQDDAPVASSEAPEAPSTARESFNQAPAGVGGAVNAQAQAQASTTADAPTPTEHSAHRSTVSQAGVVSNSETAKDLVSVDVRANVSAAAAPFLARLGLSEGGSGSVSSVGSLPKAMGSISLAGRPSGVADIMRAEKEAKANDEERAVLASMEEDQTLLMSKESRLANDVKKHEALAAVVDKTSIQSRIQRRQALEEYTDLSVEDAKLLLSQVRGENAELVAVAMRILELLATNKPNANAIARADKADGVPLLIGALNTHSESPEVFVRTCQLLANLAFENEENMNVIARRRGVQAMVTGMKHFQSEPKRLRSALNALRNMSFRNDLQQSLIAKSGAGNIIIDIITQHPSNADIVMPAVSCLVNIAGNADGGKLISEEGGFEALSIVLKENKDNKEVLELALSIFVNASSDEDADIGNKLIEMGAVENCLELLRDPKSDATKLEYSALFLANVSASCEKAIYSMMKASYPQLILPVMFHQLSNPRLINAALRSLSNIAINEENVQAIVKMNGVKLVIHSMTTHLQQAEIVEYGLILLGNFAVVESNVDLIVFEGGIDIVKNALSQHGSSEDIVGECCSFIRNLSFKHDDIKAQVREAGIPDLVISTMASFKDDPDLTENAKETLEVLGVEHDISAPAPPPQLPRTPSTQRPSVLIRDMMEVLTAMLLEGGTFKKHCKNAFPRNRTIKYNPQMRSLVWSDPNKPGKAIDSIPISYIEEIRRGCNTKAMKRLMTRPNQKKSFSLIAQHRTLDLECATEEECEQWVAAFEYLKDHYNDIQG